MGDRSPKSVQKSAAQKQSKANVASHKKAALITSQQATKAKVAAKGTKNAAMTAIANAVASALKRGVTHLQIVDTLNSLGSVVK